jgi:hypothetical protein
MTYGTITTVQAVDFLYKKLGYGVAKTDVSTRAASSETYASPFLTLGSAILQLDYSIPTYASFGAMITGGNIVTTANPTTGLPGGLFVSNVITVQTTAVVGSITNATWNTGRTNWIPVPVGGQGYQVGVFAGPPGLSISSLQGSGASSTGPAGTVAVPVNGVASDSWFFDYQAGILNFVDVSVPTTVSNVSNVVYITGAVYSGYTGITNWANLSVTGNINSTSGNINLTNGSVTAQNFYGTFQGTIGGTAATANVSLYQQLTNNATNATFYLPFHDKATGNAASYTNTTVNVNPSTGTLNASILTGTLSATNVVGTVATSNVSIYDQVTATSTNASYYPMLSTQSTSGNSITGVNSSLTYNPSSGLLTAISFTGTVNSTVPTANASIYTGLTNTATGTYYPVLSTQNATGNILAAASNSLSYNAATGALTATSFSGSGASLTSLTATNVVGTVATANASIYAGVTNTSTGTYYPVLSTQSTTGNTASAVNASLSYNAATGALTATSFSGTIVATNVTGTVATANVSLYEQLTNSSLSQTYYISFYDKATGNASAYTNTTVNVNPGTGQVNSLAANVTTLNVGSTSVLVGQVQITNATPSTTYGSGALVVSGGLGVAGAAFFNSNVSINGNLVVTGNNISLGATSLSITDPIINLNTPQDLSPLTVPTTSDIGLKFHYYDFADSAAFAGRTVVDGYFTYWAKGSDTANVFTGTILGTVKGGGLILANARVLAGGLSANTGSMQVWGDGSITGNLYVGNGLQNTPIGTLGSSTGNFTTVTATTVNAATIGNTGATLVGTLSGTNVSGTVTTANAAIYTGVTNTSTGTYYPVLSTQSTTGNTQSAVNSTLTYNAATGALTTTSFSGALTGTASTANASIYAGVTNTSTGTYYPLLSTQSTTGNTQTAASSSLSYNAATGTLSATNFSGTIIGTMATANVAIWEQITNTSSGTYYPMLSTQSTSGNTQAAAASTLSFNAATGALNATSFNGTVVGSNVTGTVPTSNAAIYAGVTNTSSGTYYPVLSTQSTTGNTASAVNASLSYNAATGALTATSFSGTVVGSNVTGTVPTANASIYAGVTNTSTGTYYPVLSTQSTTGNTQSAVNSTLTYNAATGALTATSFSGTVVGSNVTGTVPTANAAIYTGITNTATGTYYPVLSTQSTTGNTQTAASSSLSYNAATGTLSATNFSGTIIGTMATANVAIWEQVTATSTNASYYPMLSTQSTTGNTQAGVNSSLSYNPSTGILTTTSFSGSGASLTNLTATNINGTVATANVSLYDQFSSTSVNGTFYPSFFDKTSGNGQQWVSSSLSYNPSTGALTSTSFSGSGASLTNLTATNVTGTVATANASIYAGVTSSSTNASYFPMLSTQSATGNTAALVNSSLTYNPSSGLLSATTFSGAGTLSTLTTSSTIIASGNIVAASGTISTNTTTGALVISGTGGVGVGGNVIVGGNVVVGTPLNYTPLNAPIRVGYNINGYSQFTIQNANNGNNASTDIAAVANNGSDNDTYVDMGILSSTYSQAGYTLYNPNDGYLIVAGNTTTLGGNLILNTYQANDIIFATGGTQKNNEVARITSGNVLVVKSTNNANPAANIGAVNVWGGASITGNTYHGGATIFNGSQTAGNDMIFKGKNDSTLLWARPGTYDTVIIGNSATSSTVVPGAKLLINTNDSIMLPVGTNAQRPTASGLGTDTAGMFRYSSTSSSIEWYNGASWASASSAFTVITDQQFTPSGSTNVFTLTYSATTASVIVSINGVVQIPTLAYSVSGTTLTFTENPLVTDIIDVRTLTTTTTVTGLSSTLGRAQINVDDTSGIIFSSGTSGNVLVFSMPAGGGLVSQDANVSVSSANTLTTLDTINNSLYRTAKYVVQVTNGTSYQAMEALVIQNGTTATISTYSVVQTASNLGILSATVSGGNTLVQFVAANATNNVRLFRQYMPL